MPVATKEQQVAQLLEKFNDLFEGDDSLPNVIDRVKALQEFCDGIKDLDMKSVVEEVDKLKAANDSIRKAIKSNRHSRGFVAGFEDLDEKSFSLCKVLTAVARKSWDGAGFEKEVMDAAKEAAPTSYKAQNVGDDTMGGYFVPDAVIPDVIEAIYTRSVFIALQGEGETSVSVLDGMTGAPVRIPKFDGGTIAYWVGEEDAIAESGVKMGQVTMNPKQLGVLVRLTDAMQKWPGFGFERLLRNDMARAAAKKLDYTVAYGEGGNHEPQGILKQQNIKVFRAETKDVYDLDKAQGKTDFDAVSDWQGGELDFDDLDNMQLALEEDDVDIESTFKYISAPRYFRRLKQRKVTEWSGQPANESSYLIRTPILPDSALSSLIGAFGKSNQIPNNKKPGAMMGLPTTSGVLKHGEVFAGNLGEVLVGRWGGIEVSDDAARGKDFASGHLNMKLILYLDVGFRQPRGIIVSPDVQIRA